MRSDDERIDQERDPDSEVYDVELRDEEEPVATIPGEEIDPDSTRVDRDLDENIYDDEGEYQHEPL